MKAGRPKWTSKIPPAELQAVHDWIDSSADYQAADIFRAMNLRRYCTMSTFRRYAAERREDVANRQSDVDSVLPPSSFSQQSLEELTRAAIGKALLTGEVPAYALPKILSSLASIGGLELRRTIYEDAREKLRKAADEKTGGGQQTLTREDVYDMVDAVMTGGA
jgi:hypothetical protein